RVDQRPGGVAHRRRRLDEEAPRRDDLLGVERLADLAAVQKGRVHADRLGQIQHLAVREGAAPRRQEVVVLGGGVADGGVDVLRRREIVEPDVARLVYEAGGGFAERLVGVCGDWRAWAYCSAFCRTLSSAFAYRSWLAFCSFGSSPASTAAWYCSTSASARFRSTTSGGAAGPASG